MKDLNVSPLIARKKREEAGGEEKGNAHRQPR